MNLSKFCIPLILGDININTLVKNTVAKEYFNLVHSESFNPLIFETISCVDHIHSNFVTSSTSGSIAVEIADHLPVSCHGMSIFIILVVILAEVSILSLK